MPDTLNNYVLQERPIVPMVDLGILSNSLATINQGNKEALKTQSELKAAIGNIDLNEAEDGYKEQLYNDIEKTVEDNSIEGNAYFALDDLITKKGDIEKNEGLLGRIKAQQAYKKNIADLDERVKRGDITRDTAEWAKEMNPYYYEDKYKTDVNGNVVLGKDGKPIIIGGTDWAPDLVPVKDVDINKVYALASQYIKPKRSSWESTTFVDENGNISKTYKPGYFILNKVDGKKEEVTRQMVDNAINMAINANPEIEASMKQSFEVAKWKYSKGDINNNLAYDNTGKLKSYNQYRNDLIDPYINQMIYSETQSSTEWNNSGLQLMYKQKAKEKTSKIGNGSGIDPLAAIQLATSAMGHPILLDTDLFGSSIGTINQGKATLAQIAKVGINEIPDTYEDYVKLLGSGMGPKSADELANEQLALKAAKDFYDAYGAQIINNNNRANSNSELDAATLVEQYLEQNIPLSQLSGTNPYIQPFVEKYNTYIDNMFQDSQYIKFTPKDINKIIKSNDDKERLASLGIEISNGSLILSKDNDNVLYTFMDLLDGQNGDIYRGDNNNWQRLNKGLGRRILEGISMGTGSAGSSRNTRERFDFFNDTTQDFVDESFKLKKDIISVYRKNAVDQVKEDQDKILVGTGTLGSYTVGDAIAQQILEETGEAKVKSMREAAKSRVLNLARSGNLVDTELYRVLEDDKGGYYYQEIDRAEKLKITNELSNINDNDITGNLSYIQGYEFKQGISYPRVIYDKEGKNTHTTETIKLIFGTNQNDPELERLNSTDMIRTGKELMGSYINGESLNVGKVGNSYITIQGIQDSKDIKYSDTYKITVGGDVAGVVNTTDGISLLNAYRTAINDRKTFVAGDNPEQALANYVQSNPFIYDTYVKIFGEETAFNILASIMLK